MAHERDCVVTPYTLDDNGQTIYGKVLGPGDRYVELRLDTPTMGDDGEGGYTATGAWAATDTDNVLYQVYTVPGMPLPARDDAPVFGTRCVVRATAGHTTAGWECCRHGLSGTTDTDTGTDPYLTGPVQCVAARRALYHQ